MIEAIDPVSAEQKIAMRKKLVLLVEKLYRDELMYARLELFNQCLGALGDIVNMGFVEVGHWPPFRFLPTYLCRQMFSEHMSSERQQAVPRLRAAIRRFIDRTNLALVAIE